MELCDTLLAKAIEANCEGIKKGADSEAVIINRADVDFSNSVVATDGSITSIAFKSGKKGYKAVQPGNTPFTGTQTALAVGTYMNTFTHDVALVVLDNDQSTSADIIDKLANGEFIVVIKKKNTGDSTTANGRYQVYGWDNGLRASEATSELYSEDTNGGWAITLQETGALKSARYLVGTSAEATDAAFTALTTAA